MNDDMSKHQKGSFGYFIELAKKDGFDNIKDWNEWRKQTGKMPNPTEIKRKEYNIVRCPPPLGGGLLR